MEEESKGLITFDLNKSLDGSSVKLFYYLLLY